jgi:hypothetical protein
MTGVSLPSSKNTESQPWQGNQVQALVRALLAGQDFANLPFAQYLMKRQEALVKDSTHLDDGDLAAYNRLLGILRDHLETELEETLAQFRIKGLSQSRVAKLSAAFWGALTVHIELFLRQDPITGQPLIVEASGEYRVAAEGQPVFIFREPLTIQAIISLVQTLGRPWLDSYLTGYVFNKNIPLLFKGLSEKQEDLFEWVNTRDLRTVRRARQRLYQRLGSRDNLENRMASSRPAEAAKSGARSETAKNPLLAASPDKSPLWLADYRVQFKEWLDKHRIDPYIEPALVLIDEQGNPSLASAGMVDHFPGFTILAGLTGSGKTRFLIEAASRRSATNQSDEISIFIDLADYTQSGLPDLFEYVSAKLLSASQLSIEFAELRRQLWEMERRKRVYWYMDSWERILPLDRQRLFNRLAMLSNVLLATDNAQEYMENVKRFNAGLPIRSICIQPLDRAKQYELIQEYSKGDQNRQEALTALAQQLPGMSALSAGLHYLSKVRVASLAEILLGFLNSHQTGKGHPPVSLSVTRRGHTSIIDWGNPYVNSVFEIVAALQQRGPGKQFDVTRLERLDRIILGSYLSPKTKSLESRMKQADDLFQAGCHGGLLYRTELNKYEFVVPEVGYLMAAVAVYGASPPGFFREQATVLLAEKPGDVALQILSVFADWYASTDFIYSDGPVEDI